MLAISINLRLILFETPKKGTKNEDPLVNNAPIVAAYVVNGGEVCHYNI
jgi:hypothetical protein